MNKKIAIEGNEYELIKNYKDGFDYEELLNKYTDYFQDFDYIFGDYSYDKLRLKGFNDNDNSNVSKINTIDYLDIYIKDYCSYECRYFLLKKVEKSK